MRKALRSIAVLLVLLFCACHAKQNGAIEGSVVPAGTAASISALQGGKNILTVSAGQDGKFKLALAAGSYTVSVSGPNAPYPVQLNDIVVKPGETTTLTPVELTSQAGKSVLTGRVIPARPDSVVTLIYEGKERAAVHTDSEGKYEFRELPAGTYEVRAKAPGHAEDVSPVVISENQNVEQKAAVLLPIVAIDGVDWTAGKIRAAGIGLPPASAANDSVRRAMAERAALADARRNMLRTIEQIKIDDGRNVKDAMRSKDFTVKIQGFLQGCMVVSERELEGGKIEVVLELPLTGPMGLSRYIAE